MWIAILVVMDLVGIVVLVLVCYSGKRHSTRRDTHADE